MPRAASLFAPYFRRRNGPNARVARATKRMWQVSKTPGRQKGEQNHARNGSDGNHVDQVVPGHRQRRGHIGERPAHLRFDFCDVRIAFPRRRVRLLGSLTLTLSLSRFVPDLRTTMAWLRT